MNKCIICKKLKDQSDFYKNGKYIKSYCKSCESRRSVNWSKKNPGKNRKRALDYLDRHKLEEIESAGKRIHLLLYGGDRENDPQYTEWRSDLEISIFELIDSHKSYQLRRIKKQIRKTKEELCKKCSGNVYAEIHSVFCDKFNELLKKIIK